MTLRPASPAQVRALADEVRAKFARERALLIRAAPVWDGPQELPLASGTARVVTAASPLAVRAALTEPASGELLVVLTDVAEAELGPDVLARVAKERVLPVHPWSMVRNRYSLSGLDPTFTDEPWMADALIQYEPIDGWNPAPGGFLTVEHAWAELSQRWLGLAPTGQLADLVSWVSQGGVGALGAAAEQTRDGVRRRIETLHPEPVSTIMKVAVAGRAGDVIPLGLVARTVFSPAGGAAFVEARVRFALELGERTLSESTALAWAAASESVVADVLGERGLAGVDAWLARAEHLAADFATGSTAGDSQILASGLEQRYAQVAGLICAALAGDHGASARLGSALNAVAGHRLVSLDRARFDVLQAAVRLCRREVNPVVPETSIDTMPAAARWHRTDSSWADRARQLIRRGDLSEPVALAYTALLVAADARRERENEKFAQLLRQWSVGEPGASDHLVPIERVLTDVVVPLAGERPVLVLVLDGMSWSVATELLAAIEAQGWLLVQPSEGIVPVGVATLPTVTRISRASLLCGARVAGEMAVEKARFAAVPALRALGGPPPKLFHKSGLDTADGTVISDEVRDTVRDPHQRVVGIVINAIDDHLSRGDQVAVRWDLDVIKPLRQLLSEAAAAGRTVVITSDHGHVFEERGRTNSPRVSDAAERWRHVTTPPTDGEVVIRGPRVLVGDGEVVMPWTETLRYGTHKHGYHGGATPQEVLVPIFVLARSSTVPAGWERSVEEPPAWWRGGLPAPVPRAEVSIPPPTNSRASAAQPGLFDTVDAVASPPASAFAPWITALLASPAYVARRTAVARAQLDDALVAAVLGALERRGGSAVKETLAADIDRPLFRVDGLVQSLRRLLNIEGYSIIEVHGDTVRLHRDRLLAQFEVSAR